MYYKWPEENAAYEADHQYLFGDLLVAPITERSKELGMAEKKVWLPDGIWTDIFADVTYTGGRWITVYRDAGSIPVFAQSGTILPLNAQAENACTVPDELDVYVYSGDGCYTLNEGTDVGNTVFIASMIDDTTQQLQITAGYGRKYHVFFKNVPDGQCEIKINGICQNVRMKRNRCLQAIFSLKEGQTAIVTVRWTKANPGELIKANLLKRFIQLPLDNWYKEKQWEKISAESSTAEILKWIEDLNLSVNAKKILAETVSG